jgi:hypothetical protein
MLNFISVIDIGTLGFAITLVETIGVYKMRGGEVSALSLKVP